MAVSRLTTQLRLHGVVTPWGGKCGQRRGLESNTVFIILLYTVYQSSDVKQSKSGDEQAGSCESVQV